MRNSGTPVHKLPARLRAQVEAAAQAAPAGRPAWPFTVWINYRVPSLNAVLFKHWRAVRRVKAEAAKALDAALAVWPASSWPAQGNERVHVVITCFVIQPRDADNPTPKFLIDALRARGILRDDDPGSMALTVNPDVRVAGRALEGTRVTIAEAMP